MVEEVEVVRGYSNGDVKSEKGAKRENVEGEENTGNTYTRTDFNPELSKKGGEARH